MIALLVSVFGWILMSGNGKPPTFGRDLDSRDRDVVRLIVERSWGGDSRYAELYIDDGFTLKIAGKDWWQAVFQDDCKSSKTDAEEWRRCLWRMSSMQGYGPDAMRAPAIFASRDEFVLIVLRLSEEEFNRMVLLDFDDRKAAGEYRDWIRHRIIEMERINIFDSNSGFQNWDSKRLLEILDQKS